MNICVQVFSGLMCLILLGIYRGVELLDHMIIRYLTLRSCQTVFQSGYTTLHSHQ